jgi:hypothetical protein
VVAEAEELAVPLQLQVDLSVKVMDYAQVPAVQSADRVRICILKKDGHAESERTAIELRAAFERVGTIAGRPHAVSILAWTDAEGLLEGIRRNGWVMIYLTPGLAPEMPSIARALRGTRVITISAVDSYVSEGALLGFELLSGHPKMVFNIGQSRKQEVTFRSAVLNLMRIVQ